MNYDEKMREKIREAVAQRVWKAAGRRNVTHAWIVGATLDALDPITLKTEDGRLAEMERVGLDPGGCTLYREKWEAPE